MTGRHWIALALLASVLLLAACGPEEPHPTRSVVTDAPVEPTLTPPDSSELAERFNSTPLNESRASIDPVRYRSCEEARDAGDFPLIRGRDSGYSKGLDRDGDGIACEVKP